MLQHQEPEAVASAADKADVAAPMRAPLVVALVAETFGVSPQAIMGRSRLRPVLQARRCCLYLLYTSCGMGLDRLARHFGISRRTAALAIAAVEEWRESEQADALLERLEAALRSAAIARAIHQRHLRKP